MPSACVNPSSATGATAIATHTSHGDWDAAGKVSSVCQSPPPPGPEVSTVGRYVTRQKNTHYITVSDGPHSASRQRCTHLNIEHLWKSSYSKTNEGLSERLRVIHSLYTYLSSVTVVTCRTMRDNRTFSNTHSQSGQVSLILGHSE